VAVMKGDTKVSEGTFDGVNDDQYKIKIVNKKFPPSSALRTVRQKYSIADHTLVSLELAGGTRRTRRRQTRRRKASRKSRHRHSRRH
jgi:hypothetical protein